MYFGRFLDACEAAYQAPQIQGGPDGRDAACVIEHEDCYILAFRGTLSDGPTWRVIEDWLNDFHAHLVQDDRFPGKVHAGFASSLTALWPGLVEKASSVVTQKRFVITGHSKGGALAFLAGYLLRECEPLVITFGAPRAGDHEFASAYNVPTFRFENPADRVPYLPPVFYEACGSAVTAPRSFEPPFGIAENHHLETGYRPWVI